MIDAKETDRQERQTDVGCVEGSEQEEHSLKTALIKKLVEQDGEAEREWGAWRKEEIKDSVEHAHQRALNDKGCH